MKNSTWQSMRKHKLAGISFTTLAILAVIYGSLLGSNNKGAKAATNLCYGGAGTFTASAPSSVSPGQAFTVTNIAGFANTNIAYVNSTTLTFAISGAAPSSVDETWSGGPVHGDYEADYANLPLTATGPVGSQITVSLTSILAHITIGVTNTTINCTVANGQLTANAPGQSLTFVTVNVVAPPTVTPTTTPITSTPSSKAAPATPAVTPTTTTPTPSSTPTNTQSDKTVVSQSTVNIIVKDYYGQPIKNARVILDSMPPVKTDSSGTAQFKDIGGGSHNLSVIASGKTITQVIKLDSQNASKTLNVQVHTPAPSHTTRNLVIGSLIGLIIIAGSLVLLIRRRVINRQAKSGSNQPAPPPSVPPNTMVPPQIIGPEHPSSPTEPPDAML